MPSSIALPPLWEPRPPPAQSKDGVPANRNQTQRRIFRLLVALTALIALWDQPLLPMGLSPNTKVFSALAVTKQRPQVAGYDRAAFGDGWATLPDGSTTREAIIAHQLGPGGTGTDPYSGAPIAAARGHGAHDPGHHHFRLASPVTPLPRLPCSGVVPSHAFRAWSPYP